MTKISVIIPAFNEEHFICETLKSICIQSRKADEIIVIDNNSTDKTAEIALQYGAKVIKEKRQGVQFAISTGFTLATGDIICSTDADTIVPVDWIKKIEETVAYKNCAVTGPCFYPDAPAIIQFGAELLPKLYGFGYKGEMIGANFAFWKNLYREIGGVNTSLKSSWDIELGDRVRKIGKLYYDPNLIVSTSGRRFKNKNTAEVLAKYYINYLGVKFKKPKIISELPNARHYEEQ